MSRVDVKVVLLGSSGCGKTSLVERYLHDRFQDRYMPTIGAAFGAKRVESYGKVVKLGVWDTAGQERYKAMSRIYYRGAKAAVVCYDITTKQSFSEARFWVQELLKQEEGCKVYLCGTKHDLVDGPENKPNRQVDYHATTDFADEVNATQRRVPHDTVLTAQVFETSSKTGHNVVELFQIIANDFVSNPVNEPIVQELESIHLQTPKPQRAWPHVCCSY